MSNMAAFGVMEIVTAGSDSSTGSVTALSRQDKSAVAAIADQPDLEAVSVYKADQA
jgi:hypothetical protein